MFKPEAHIVVIDRQVTQRKIVNKLLEQLDFNNITEVGNGQDAWSMMDSNGDGENKVELVICNSEIPLLPAKDLLFMVHGDARFQNVPFLFIAPHSKLPRLKELTQDSMSAFLTTPLELVEFQKAIKSLYSKAKT